MRSAVPFLAATTMLSVLPATAAPTLIPHRAVYDLVLDQASEKSGITGLQGRMVYEFNGSPCEGYTVNFRFVTKINTREVMRTTDQQTTTFEDADGKNFSFVTKSFVDQSLDKELRGTAVREPQSLKVDIEKPQKKEVDLSATQFPTQHLIEVIEKAEKGESFFETNLFDGSEDGDKIMTTTVIVGKPTAPDAADPELKALSASAEDKPEAPKTADPQPAPMLDKDRFWPVDIAYFDQKGDGGEELPDYRISFKLHANGITRDLEMDYNDFSMKGTLVNLAMLPPSNGCQPK